MTCLLINPVSYTSLQYIFPLFFTVICTVSIVSNIVFNFRFPFDQSVVGHITKSVSLVL